MKNSVWLMAVVALAAMVAAGGAFGEGRDGVPCGFMDEGDGGLYECGTPYVESDDDKVVKSAEEIRRDHKAAAMAAVEAVVRERKIELIRAREAAKEEAARDAREAKAKARAGNCPVPADGKCVRLAESNRPPRRCGGLLAEPPPRVFPEWKPEGKDAKGGDSRLAAELSALVAQGRRDRAASPEFLTALERLAKRYADAAETKSAPSDRLPMRADWQGTDWPVGWESVRRDVWTFGNGKARQKEARPDTRYVLFYEPGKKWRDYAVKVRFESDAWFVPPSRSAAEVWVRCKGVDEAYRVEWCGAGDMAVIIREGAGKERTLARASVPVDVVRDGKPWTVRVRGSQITVEHEGRFYLEVNDPTYREGSVGVESIHIPVSFDALEVETL